MYLYGRDMVEKKIRLIGQVEKGWRKAKKIHIYILVP